MKQNLDVNDLKLILAEEVLLRRLAESNLAEALQELERLKGQIDESKSKKSN